MLSLTSAGNHGVAGRLMAQAGEVLDAQDAHRNTPVNQVRRTNEWEEGWVRRTMRKSNIT